MDSPTTKLPDDHLDIRAGGWELHVRPQRQTAETAAFRSTLCAVTHFCTLRRNALFTSDDAQAFLRRVQKWVAAQTVERNAAVTHFCTLRRNALFPSDDAQAFLALLHDALSFAAGQWVGQVFVRGFDRSEERRVG